MLCYSMVRYAMLRNATLCYASPCTVRPSSVCLSVCLSVCRSVHVLLSRCLQSARPVCHSVCSARFSLSVIFFCIIFSTNLARFLLGSFGSTNTSWEHHIRADLLENYDRKVRPVLRGKKEVEVSFALRVSRLVKVVRESHCFSLKGGFHGYAHVH